MDIKSLLNDIPNHENDINWLANTAVNLSRLLYNLGDEVSQAELLENEAVTRYLNSQEKIPVSAAQIRGLAETQNNYGRLKLEYQSLVEVINSLKKKVDLSMQQLKSGV